jgi:holo-[acyl-carrier protein] synthase
MIKGVGADFLEKSRIENVFLKFGNKFVNKILSEKESYEFNKKINLTKKVSYLSNNFACKEAVSKVLGTGFSQGVLIKDIEILRSEAGAPYTNLHGEAGRVAKKRGVEKFHLTITDTKDYSLAFAIGEQR